MKREPWRERRPLAIVLALLMNAAPQAEAADRITLYAAGSLKAALTDVAKAYEEAYGTPVEMAFAASGLLRERIEGGEQADVFASANMQHPGALMAAGWGGRSRCSPATSSARWPSPI
jgi:molybdate transport system substrate-binding protein